MLLKQHCTVLLLWRHVLYNRAYYMSSSWYLTYIYWSRNAQTIVLTILDQVTILDFQMEPDFDWGVFWLGNCLFTLPHILNFIVEMTIFSLYFSENWVISMGINVDGRKNYILDLLKFKVDLKYSSFNKHFLSMYIV